MTNQETLAKYLTDMRAAEHHLAHTLRSQIDDKDLGHYAEATSLLKRLLMRTENALSSLEILIQQFGGEARGTLKEKVTHVTGAVMGAISHTRSHNVSKMLRDDYTTLSLISISYELLHATGNALEAPPVASLALTNLKDVAGFIMEISQGIIPVAVEELGETNKVVSGSITTSQDNIKKAWQAA